MELQKAVHSISLILKCHAQQANLLEKRSHLNPQQPFPGGQIIWEGDNEWECDNHG